MRKQSIFRLRCAVALAISTVLSAGSGLAAEAVKVKWGVNNPYFPANTPVNIGVKAGIFAKHGLDVEIVPTQSPMPPLLAGSTNVTSGGVPPWLNAVAQGKNPQVIATLLPKSSQAIMVKPDSPVAEVRNQWPAVLQALKGKKIGVTVPGAQVDLSTRYLLMQAGLDPDKDVSILSLGSGAPQVAALEQGRVDAIMAVVPFVQILATNKKAVAVFDYTSLPSGVPAPVDQPYMIVTGNPKFLKENPDVAPRIRAALKDIGVWMMDPANTQTIRDELAEGFGTGVTPEAIDGILEQLRRGGFRTEFTCTDFANGVSLMKDLKILDRNDLKCSDYVLAP